MKKIIVLGASGMLGHKVFEVLSKYSEYDVYGTVTSLKSFHGCLPKKFEKKIFENIYANKVEDVFRIFQDKKPDVVINCIGIIKQKKDSNKTKDMILLNSLFPHQISEYCEANSIKFITIATDCVFDGSKIGSYMESDIPTCHDVYGMSKYLGETKYNNSLTLRTSIIGHEINSNLSLVDWFLSQKDKSTKGFLNAIFSGLPTIELAEIIAEKIIPNKDLTGLYHISSNFISKYELLKLVSKEYKKNIDIIPDSNISINRALNSDLLKSKINYISPSWELLIKKMYEDFINSEFYILKQKKYAKYNYF